MYQDNYDDVEFGGDVDLVANSYANSNVVEGELDEEELIMQAQAGVQSIPEP
ncbi:hypothetical protein EV175_007408, partial [Coemansia sp. RSA 1933]